MDESIGSTNLTNVSSLNDKDQIGVDSNDLGLATCATYNTENMEQKDEQKDKFNNSISPQ